MCLRAGSACICRWIAPSSNTVEVLILQHPLEVHHPKGSARLLHLSLLQSRLVVGEAFGHEALHELLTAPWCGAASDAEPRQAVLLYPDSPVPASGGTPAPHATLVEPPFEPLRLRLVVLDGTWRKSRKMLHLNPLLQRLPRLALHDVPTSHYLIRKAHRADQRSTLEATCAALAQLEGEIGRYEMLLCGFEGFVEQQLSAGAQARECASSNPGSATPDAGRGSASAGDAMEQCD